MFKKKPTSGLSAKIAHTTLMPSLVGNKDLRLLQDFITAEKSVVIGLQKLAIDTARAAETLKFWGQGEGDDLGDVLSHSAGMILHFCDALNRYAVHEQNIRALLKGIRSDEEYLDRLKKDRRSVGSKADSAEKKLQKLTPESKNLQEQTDLLTRLREEMKALDSRIVNEEARLGDFKRQTSKQLLLLKFGGLLECAEKAKVAGEFGKALAQEVPLETTIPGHARVYYNAYDSTSKLASDASRAITEIVFEAPEAPLPSDPIGFPTAPEPNSPVSPGGAAVPSVPHTFGGYPAHSVHSGSVDEFGKHAGPSAPPRFNTYQALPLSATQSPYAPPPGSPPKQSASGGHFATFPAARHGGTMDETPSTRPSTESQQPFMPPPAPVTVHDIEPSFSDSVADALAADSYLGSLDGDLANPQRPSGVDYTAKAPGVQSHPTEGHVPPASTEKPSHTRYPDDSHGNDSEGTILAYASERKSPTKSRKLSESLDDAYDGATHWLRKQSETPGAPLRSPRSSQDQHRNQSPPRPFNSSDRPVQYRDEAEANSAAMREVSREMDALAFNSIPRRPDPDQQPIAGTYAPMGPPPPLSNVLRNSRPASLEVSTAGNNGIPQEPNTLSRIPPPPRQVQPPPTMQPAGGSEQFAPQNKIEYSSPPVVANLPTPASPLPPPPKLNSAAISPSSGPPSPRTISASAFRRPFAKKSALGLTGGTEEDGATVAGPPYSSIPAREAPIPLNVPLEPSDNRSTTSIVSNATGPANTSPLNVRSKPRLPATPYPPTSLTPGARPSATSSISDITTTSAYTASEGRGEGDGSRVPERDVDEQTYRQSTQLPPYSPHPETGHEGSSNMGEIPDEAEFMRELELEDHGPPSNQNGSRGYGSGRYSTSLQ